MSNIKHRETKRDLGICSSEFSQHEALWVTNNSWPFYAGYKREAGGLSNLIGECGGDLDPLDTNDWYESFKLKDNGKEKEKH